VNDTVDTAVMHARLGIDDTIPLQRIVREIRRQVAPTPAVLEYQARLEYQREIIFYILQYVLLLQSVWVS
jgi:hypothetical protein